MKRGNKLIELKDTLEVVAAVTSVHPTVHCLACSAGPVDGMDALRVPGVAFVTGGSYAKSGPCAMGGPYVTDVTSPCATDGPCVPDVGVVTKAPRLLHETETVASRVRGRLEGLALPPLPLDRRELAAERSCPFHH